jgi:hypothetical protein
LGPKQHKYFKYLRWPVGLVMLLMCLSVLLFAAFRNGYFASIRPQKQAGIENVHGVNKPASTFLSNQSIVTQTNSQSSQDKTTNGVAPQQTNIVPAPDKGTPQSLPKSTPPKTDLERTKKMVKIKVKQGDSFIQLIKDFYGRSDKDLLVFIKTKNPHIQDLHKLRQGNVLYFPNASEIPQP